MERKKWMSYLLFRNDKPNGMINHLQNTCAMNGNLDKTKNNHFTSSPVFLFFFLPLRGSHSRIIQGTCIKSQEKLKLREKPWTVYEFQIKWHHCYSSKRPTSMYMYMVNRNLLMAGRGEKKYKQKRRKKKKNLQPLYWLLFKYDEDIFFSAFFYTHIPSMQLW